MYCTKLVVYMNLYLKELIVINCVLGVFKHNLAITLKGIVAAIIVLWDYLRFAMLLCSK